MLSFAQWGNWGGNGGGKTINDYKKVSVSGRDIHAYAPSKAEEQGNYPNAENSGGTMYTWGPCDKGGGYIKHLKHPGRGHSSSHADVSDTWNFVKLWDVNGLISENLNQNHQILPK